MTNQAHEKHPSNSPPESERLPENEALEKTSDKTGKRLEKLRKGRKLAKLTYPDLIFLLEEDDMLREILRKLFGGAETEPPPARNAPARTPARPAAPPPIVKTLPDPLRTDLADALSLLKKIQADPELARWLGNDKNASEGRQLMRLIAHAAQWDEIKTLWDMIARRCTDGKRLASTDERAVLESCLVIYNLRWHVKQAKLVMVPEKSAYDYRTMQRLVNASGGETVHALALPGLQSSGGTLEKKPLVKTDS